MGAPIDAEIAKLALRQQGNVTTEQLLGLGVGRRTITYRCRKGRLHREHVGVYSVGRPARTGLEKAAAAVLACGPGAALSHHSALRLWELDDKWWFPLHVTAPRDCRRPGIITHRSHALTPRDIRTVNNIRVTSPARTVLDCAPTLTDERLKRVIADGRRNKTRPLSLSQLRDVISRFPTHPGRSLLEPLIQAEDEPTRSPLEDDFVAFCRHYGLPRPIVNSHVCGREVDAWFPVERLIVEVDGWGFHRDRDSFEADRDHDATALAAGIPTVRVTSNRMSTPAREADRLQRILAHRRA